MQPFVFQECLYLMIDVRLMDSESTPTSSSAGSDMEDNEVRGGIFCTSEIMVLGSTCPLNFKSHFKSSIHSYLELLIL